MANQVVKVKRETIAALITCPLCNKLLRNATTISECLHTFCRKCIYRKISDEGVDYCPICNIDLGCVPLEKLRRDHSLQDVRAKLFPSKRRKVVAPEVETSVESPVKQKEKSLSSLVVSAPKVLTQTTKAERSKNSVQRKTTASKSCSFRTEKRIKKEELEENDGEVDLWQPLNCLVEVANRTKSFKADVQLESIYGLEKKLQLGGTKLKENEDKTNIEKEKNNTCTSDPEPRKRRRKAVKFGDSNISYQAVLDAANVKHERRACPVWFSLVASEDQEGNAPLPQIPSHYLRIKDGNMRVSFIHKYLMKKLHLASEAEVEIKCMGQPVLPTLLVYNLVDIWIQSISTSERIAASIGSSAKDFVMVLAYARKNPDSK